MIRQNRAHLFTRREYRDSRHSLRIAQIRCVSSDVAIAEAKWELRGVVTTSGGEVPPVEGLATLILRKAEAGWLIEAYRYTIARERAPGPVLLERPGAPDAIR